MNSLKYLIKNDLNNELDLLLEQERKMSLEYYGKICKKCGVKQGLENKGVKKYYCGHISARIDQRLKKESKKIFKKVFIFTVSSTCQKDL